ncbi:MAG TPA: ribosome recycling factor, partial [Devosiaceae bacterium]|nr:ribosome recycling factor [Devosiaceae bacterium]
MHDYSLDELRERMRKSIGTLHDEFAGLRTGRASASLLEPIMVEAYGAQMPINQVATVSAPEVRLITVQVWDKSMTQAVDRAIRESS